MLLYTPRCLPGLSIPIHLMYKTKPMKRFHFSLVLTALLGCIITGTAAQTAAKPAGEGRLTHEELKPLLRQLLEQRFKLATHRGTQDRPGYELVVAKGGPKLTESSGTATHIYILRDGLDCQGIPAGALAGMLSRPAGRPVVDKTGLKGVYDIKLEYAPEGTGDSSRPSFFSALQDQLGLKLAPQRVTVETLTIDRVERIPTEN